MANISIGGVTPADNPTSMTLVRPDKKNAVVETYSSVAYFSWGASIVGKIIELVWDFMSTSNFTSLDALFTADAVVVFNPQTGTTYNVNILSLDGEYFLGVQDDLRKNVKMQLLIMSQVA